MSDITWGVDGYGRRHYLCHECGQRFGEEPINHECEKNPQNLDLSIDANQADSSNTRVSQQPNGDETMTKTRNGNDTLWTAANNAIANRDGMALINALEGLMDHTADAVDMLATGDWMTRGQLDRVAEWNARC